MPSASELRAILEKYFPGSISDEQVKTVELLLRDILETQAKHVVESDQFYGNSQVWAGRLFLEEAKVPRAPRVVDMACVVAARLPGFPKPKPYCPEPLVGRWEDVGNSAVHWELGADGAFRTDEPEYKAAMRWYVVRRGGVVGDILHLVEQWGDPTKVGVVSASPTELVLERTPKLDRKYTLRRSR